MSEDTPPTVPAPKRSRLFDVVLVLVILGVVVAAAFYQEQLTAFFKLRLWDRDAPSRVVLQFLDAGKKGDQAAATALLGSKEFQPMKEGDKWKGYFIVSQAGRMNFDLAELAPAEPKALETEFMTLGNGAATVSVPDSKGQPVKYRLEMQDGGWKITEILGGRPGQ
jgi:hypothetical protein